VVIYCSDLSGLATKYSILINDCYCRYEKYENLYLLTNQLFVIFFTNLFLDKDIIAPPDEFHLQSNNRAFEQSSNPFA